MERQFNRINQQLEPCLHFVIFLYCIIFNNQVRSFVNLTLYAIQDWMGPRQNLDQIAELKKKICFHTFESEKIMFPVYNYVCIRLKTISMWMKTINSLIKKMAISITLCKVQTFLRGHKNLKQSSTLFDIY